MLKSENVEKSMIPGAVKITHATALEFAINYMKDDNTADVYVEDLQKLLATFVNRSAKERKPSKSDLQAAARREKIITYLRQHPDEEFSNDEIADTIYGYEIDTNVEPMLRQSVKAGIVDKRKVNGTTYWSIHVVDEAEEEM